METEHLREFIALSEAMNYAQAANACFVTEQTLRAHMRSLEEQLGCSLMSKRGGLLELTASGEVLLLKSRTIVSLVDQAILDCDLASKTLVPLTVCSLGHVLFEDVLAKASKQFIGKAHDLKIDIRMSTGMHANVKSVLDGHVDAAVFLYQCDRQHPASWEPAFPSGIASHFITEEPLYFWLNHNSTLFEKKELCAGDFEGFHLVLGNTQNMQHAGEIVEEAFKAHGVRVKVENRPYRNYSEIFFSHDSLAFGIFSGHAHRDFFMRSDYRPFQVEGLDLFCRVYVIHRKELDDERLKGFFETLGDLCSDG